MFFKFFASAHPCLLVLLTLCISQSLTQDLTLNEVARFPRTPYRPIVHYDGNEWIYIFHRVYEDPRVSAELWRLNVATLNLEQVSKTNLDFHDGLFIGTHLNSSIYAFGVFEGFTTVPVKVDLPDGNISTISDVAVPYSSYDSASIPYNNEIFMVCGGYCNSLYKFNPQTQDYSLVKEVPERYLKSRPSTTLVNDKAFIFGYPHSSAFESNQTFSVMNMNTLEFSDGPEGFLKSSGAPSAVYDGKFIYYISTHWQSQPEDPRKDGIYRIDPETYAHQFIPIQNFPIPSSGNRYFAEAPKSVFVEKLNGIFMIGGVIGTGFGGSESLETISFVDLSPVSPTTPPPPVTTTTMNPDLFSCANHTEGFYPHPQDCAKFIGCHEGTPEHYECPEPLLFDPLLGTCNIPQLVDCEISCTDKPDGLHRHPHDCSLFILCTSQELNVYKCPSPLLFDPVKNICNFPDLVTC